MNKQTKITIIVGLCAVGISTTSTYLTRKAYANPRPGLWQEQSTVVNGVTVTKVRDTLGGDYNICYVANYIVKDSMPAVSISCVPEKK